MTITIDKAGEEASIVASSIAKEKDDYNLFSPALTVKPRLQCRSHSNHQGRVKMVGSARLQTSRLVFTLDPTAGEWRRLLHFEEECEGMSNGHLGNLFGSKVGTAHLVDGIRKQTR
jgi:hypothetical protein